MTTPNTVFDEGLERSVHDGLTQRKRSSNGRWCWSVAGLLNLPDD
jgi:hypothetical protein